MGWHGCTRRALGRVAWALLVCSVLVSAYQVYDPKKIKPKEGVMGAKWLSYKIRNIFPHDPTAYCQGLLYEDGALYESTGMFGHSELRRVELGTGKIQKSYQLSPMFFGEGLASFGDRLIQLTWKSHFGFAYDRKTFRMERTFKFPQKEGWGIASNGTHLLMSDGTGTISFLNPETYDVVGSMVIKYMGEPVSMLNELEWIDGRLWANVYETDYMAIIDMQRGQVESWVDFSGLLLPRDHQKYPKIDVFNGVAFDAKKKRIFVTGKYWPKLFEVELMGTKLASYADDDEATVDVHRLRGHVATHDHRDAAHANVPTLKDNLRAAAADEEADDEEEADYADSDALHSDDDGDWDDEEDEEHFADDDEEDLGEEEDEEEDDEEDADLANE